MYNIPSQIHKHRLAYVNIIILSLDSTAHYIFLGIWYGIIMWKRVPPWKKGSFNQINTSLILHLFIIQKPFTKTLTHYSFSCTHYHFYEPYTQRIHKSISTRDWFSFYQFCKYKYSTKNRIHYTLSYGKRETISLLQ